MSEKSRNFWNMLENFKVAMVVTEDEVGLRGRPMAPTIDKRNKQILFLSEADAHKIYEIRQDRCVALTFSDPTRMDFVSVTGRASVSRDRELLETVWGPYADLWFKEGVSDANAVVVIVEPERAEFWDGDHGPMKTVFELAKSYFTDTEPDLGENQKVNTF